MNKFYKYLSVMTLASSLVVNVNAMAEEKEQPGQLVSVEKVKNEQVNPNIMVTWKCDQQDECANFCRTNGAATLD